MVWTNNQNTSFFEDAAQMAIPHATVLQLESEGITSFDDLGEFDDASLKQIAANLRRPAGRTPDPTPGAEAGATIPTPSFVFGAKSQLRLKVAAEAVRYYESVGRSPTPTMMAWTPTLKNFSLHWNSLVERKSDSTVKLETPKITKTLIVTKWTESFSDFLNRTIGVRTIPLSYVIRPDSHVTPAAPPVATGQPFADVYGSVEEELIARSSHTHALFRTDNAKVYFYLEEATRSTQFSASIKPFSRTKNGRDAWNAIVNQYAGKDKWNAELKRQNELLMNRKWKGNTNFTLDRFISQHRNAFVSLSQCALHVDFQLPNQLTRVTSLLDAIECDYAPLQAAMALIRNDTGPDGKMNDFENAATSLLPHDPVLKRRNDATSNKRPNAQISSATLKSGIGQTGVELRFYTTPEYMKLSAAQKSELHEHRNKQEAAGKSRKLSKSTGKLHKPIKPKSVSSLSKADVQKIMKEEMKKKEDDDTAASTEANLDAYILSVVNKQKTASAASTTQSIPLPPPPTPNTAQILQSILKQSKNR